MLKPERITETARLDRPLKRNSDIARVWRQGLYSRCGGRKSSSGVQKQRGVCEGVGAKTPEARHI